MNFYFIKQNIISQINISIYQDVLLVQGQTNINNNLYSLYLGLKALHNNYNTSFHKCNSIYEAFTLIKKNLDENRGFIQDINNSIITLGIQIENEIALFTLFKQNNICNNFNQSNYINNDNASFNQFNGSNNNFNKANEMNENNNMINAINNVNNNAYNNGKNNYNNLNNNFNNLNINNYGNNIVYNNIHNNFINNNNYIYQNNNNFVQFNNNDNNISNIEFLNIPTSKVMEAFEDNNKDNIRDLNKVSTGELINKLDNKENEKFLIDNNPIDIEDNLKEENFTSIIIKIKIFQPFINNVNAIIPERLSGLLKLCLLKKLSHYLEKTDKYMEKQEKILKEIFLKIKDYVHFVGYQDDFNLLIKKKKTINILQYSKYLDNNIIKRKIENIINQFLDENQKQEITNYWKCLGKYKLYNSYFEEKFIKDLKKCKFDYSLISINIIESDNQQEFEINKSHNMDKKILYHRCILDPINENFTYDLTYSKNTLNGNGFYFTDLIDNIPSFLDNERNDLNYGKIIPVNSSFTFITSVIIFDKEKIYQNNCQENVESKGIKIIKTSKNNYIKKEYIVPEKKQIFPLYLLTLKRNEYSVLWRGPDFNENDVIYKNLINFCMENNINFYGKNSTEEALKFLVKRKYDKIILITTLEHDLSGKRFIEIARKIFGFDIMVLFYINIYNKNYLEWIQNYQNCLYTNEKKVCEDYIINFNEDGLKNLKKKIEKENNVKLVPFSFDFILYPNFKNGGDYSSLEFNCHYMKSVYIKNGNRYLSMEKYGNNGKVTIGEDCCPWDITILGNEITFYSKGFYLDLNINNETIMGLKSMKPWNFEKNGDFYNFFYPKKEKNNILSICKDSVIVNKESVGENEMFQLIEILGE